MAAVMDAREKRKEKGNLRKSQEILKEFDTYNYYLAIFVTAGLWLQFTVRNAFAWFYYFTY